MASVTCSNSQTTVNKGEEKKPKQSLRKRVSNFFSRLAACIRGKVKKNKVAPAPVDTTCPPSPTCNSEDSIDFAAEQAVELAIKRSMTCELDDTL